MIKLELEKQEVDILFQLMHQVPYGQIAPLIEKIKLQIKDQEK